MPTPLQTVPCPEVKARWKESEVAIQRNYQSFLIVGCQSVLREPWWNAQAASLQWYHHDCVASVPEDALENSNVQ